jgi:hypothetical protein
LRGSSSALTIIRRIKIPILSADPARLRFDLGVASREGETSDRKRCDLLTTRCTVSGKTMKAALLPVCLFFAVAVSVCAASEPNAIRNKLDSDKRIQGIPCARGTAWFYPDGALNECTLSRAATLGSVGVPRRSIVELWPNGAAHYVTISRRALVGGYRVMGGTRASSSSAVVTTFYPSGKLRSVYLAVDQNIEGVPCRGGSAWNLLVDPANDTNYVEFFDDGKLKSCRLARDYEGYRNGQRLLLPLVTTSSDVVRTEPAQ